jgi:hypothetical protein
MSDFFIPDEAPPADGPPDFEIRISAAAWAEGATGPVTDDDRAHIRGFVKGMLAQIDAGLPIGWFVEINELGPSSSQTIFTGNPRKTQPPPELPPDRFARIETAICGGILPDESECGREIVNQGDGIWVHVEPCIEPEPREEPAVAADSP